MICFFLLVVDIYELLLRFQILFGFSSFLWFLIYLNLHFLTSPFVPSIQSSKTIYYSFPCIFLSNLFDIFFMILASFSYETILRTSCRFFLFFLSFCSSYEYCRSFWINCCISVNLNLLKFSPDQQYWFQFMIHSELFLSTSVFKWIFVSVIFTNLINFIN